MANFNKFDATSNDWLLAKNVFGTDTFKLMLTNTLPVHGNHVYGDISGNELGTSGGYTAGGATITIPAPTPVGAVATVTATAASPTWTATTGFGPFEYAVLYDSSAATKTLIGWWDYGSAVTLAAGDTFTVSWASGLLTIT